MTFNFDLDRMKEAIECPTIDLEEFMIMVEKGTSAWKDVPDDWLEDLRGNNDEHFGEIINESISK